MRKREAKRKVGKTYRLVQVYTAIQEDLYFRSFFIPKKYRHLIWVACFQVSSSSPSLEVMVFSGVQAFVRRKASVCPVSGSVGPEWMAPAGFPRSTTSIHSMPTFARPLSLPQRQQRPQSTATRSRPGVQVLYQAESTWGSSVWQVFSKCDTCFQMRQP